MNTILIIEDDTNINNLIAETLDKAGFSCVQAFSGTEGLLHAQSGKFSLIVMDLMLPGKTGEELLPKLKSLNETPIIILSAKDSLDSKIDLLNAGAEDYITKPFELDELVARVNVQIRRYSTKSDDKHEALSHKGLTLIVSELSAKIDGKDIAFTKHEYKILELLMKNPTRVFSKQDIYDYAWEDYYIGEDKTINMHISNIRKKLRSFSDEEFIETVWGIGFRLSK
ncbi:MAG: response regulator transcription factor [Ruminococcus sp.]|nr:response regulator transcription factor [Ruminococcus sp.]